ncbi:hypothetical protein B0H66DRAFT_82895 [Apodospora peruviana]|uniref:Mid2 domain-containing protein n=1 Tax=Apodospora peruviana TaxID=516989 RepID=A0AAE0ITG6_9PEZI|nr:hypothetical protein B0H66DRAFT_82895 [Apodospora peruviana]
MHSRKLLDLLVVGLGALSVAEATFINAKSGGRNVKAIQHRQAEDEGTVAAASTSSPDVVVPPPSSTPVVSSPPPKSTTTLPPTTTPSSTTQPPPPKSTTTTPSPLPPTPTTTPTSSTPAPPPDSTTPPPDQQTSEPTTFTITSVVTKTNSDGTKSTLTSETVTTQTPGLAQNNNGSGNSGMSTTTRNTVIGVVVGVGGAIVLAGLAFVAWRIWGRKRGQDENDGLMDYSSPNDGKSEVGGSMTGRTPFQSTLESYHAPTQVNQAANF